MSLSISQKPADTEAMKAERNGVWCWCGCLVWIAAGDAVVRMARGERRARQLPSAGVHVHGAGHARHNRRAAQRREQRVA